MKIRPLLLVSTWLLTFPFFSFAQWQTVYHGADSTNEIRGLSFFSASEGFAASDHYIGYTQDGGKTIQKKPISLSNVDYNGYAGRHRGGWSQPRQQPALRCH